MLKKFLFAIPLLLLPALDSAADITGIPKIRDGDQLQIGSTRIRLGGIDAPSSDQLCLNNKSEPWTCGIAPLALGHRRARRTHSPRRRQTLDLPCASDRPPRPDGGAMRGRWRGHSEMD